MSSGRPDFHPTMLLEGKHGADLIPVLVDALGQLYTIISGNYGGVPTPVLLDAAGRILAHLVGTDGINIRNVAVDANGNLIARIRGKDGLGALQDVLLDTSGNLSALIRGMDGATLRTVAVDANGVMKANLSAQDLNWLTVRPVYGQSRVNSGAGTTVTSGATTGLFSVSGRGAALGGYLMLQDADTLTGNRLHIKVDGTEIFAESLATIHLMTGQGRSQIPFYAYYWREDVPSYGIGFSTGWTFETSFEFLYENTSPNSVTVPWVFYYALIPA